MEYVSRIKQLEDLYDNSIKFEEGIKQVKPQIHSGRYNRGEWLNVLRKLTYGLKDHKVCETNLRCLTEHNLEFLNYAHDYEPMLHLLTYGSVELVDFMVSRLPVEKLIGFRNEHEPRLSLFQDLNMHCPVMIALDLLRQSKGKESIEYKQKIESMLKKLPYGFNFTLKYISNHRLFYTTPLAEMILQNEPVFVDYIKLHGGTLDTVINEPLCTSCGKSYYNFLQAEPVQQPFLDYVKQTNPKEYALLVKQTQTRTLKNRKNMEKNRTPRAFSQPSLSLNEPNVKGTSLNTTTMNTLRERIRLNKLKRNILMSEADEHKVETPKNHTGKNETVKNYSKTTKINKTKKRPDDKQPYVVVGGVGGSGTRLIASILAALGLKIGTDLNEAYDNLSFTLLYKHLNTLTMDSNTFDDSFKILRGSIVGSRNPLTVEENQKLDELSDTGRPGHPKVWLQERAQKIRDLYQNGPLDNPYLKALPQLSHKPLLGKWGWKEPNSHVIMNRLNKKTKFIMVVRNGLDMAFSSNQNQLRLWGPALLPNEMKKLDRQGHLVYSPRVSMRYWTLVHKKILHDSKSRGENFLMINFDDMCMNPEKWLHILCKFLKIEQTIVSELLPMVVYQSEGIGRFKKQDITQFAESDISFAKRLGFDTTV